ncbi:hypothetical protein TNCV_4960471 [Trichonephila clavipes]|uniref:Uncharacterized protein n=1 Tax=Trichonephila clavipes TaxID=2585209 RepID=A0A8X6SR35_TRICX|nr:hypothetical protein TNCV_4960471 [Trichonephila clavipes]
MDGKENNSLFTPGLSNSVEKDTRGTVKCYLRNGLAQWARPGIEPGTSRTLSENHTPRPPSLVKFFVLILLLYLDEVKRDFRARPGPLAPKARIIPLDHRAVSYQSDPSTQKRCQEECNYNFSMDGKENNSLFTPGLSNSVEKDTRGTVKCYLRNGLAQWARPGIEPGTSRTLSENHTPRPPSLVKSDPSTQKRCQEECNYNFSMDGKENNSLFTPGLSNSVEKDTRGTVKCYLRNGLAQWARPGIEPGTSRTLSENHTPRPPSLVKFFVLILLLYLDEVKRDFRARPGFEPGTSRTQSENHTPRPPSRVVSV